LLLLAMVHVLFAERLVDLGRLAPFTDGVDAIERAALPFTPEAVAAAAGIDAEQTRALARDFARARSAVAYGRVGLCQQEFGGLGAWLVVALNVLTGNLDRPGGSMLTRPAVDLVRVATPFGQKGHFGRYRTRVRGLPEFGGELPVAALAEEIETEGKGRIRALVTIAGNPVLSVPNGARLERALARLDFMVSLDLYRNETTRHAHLLLPTSFGLECDHFDAVLNVVAVRNVARYAKPVFEPPPGVRHDWSILVELSRRIACVHARAARLACGGVRARDGHARCARRSRPHAAHGTHRLSLRDLEAHPHGIDLGALEPQLPERLRTRDRRIRLAPRVFLDELPRLAGSMHRTRASNELFLVGRRALRSNNSWMHNSHRLVKGPPACTLLMHPSDARARSLTHGQRVRVRSRVGEVRAPLEVSDEIAPGVVSLPHGWGHHRDGVQLDVARAHAGVSVNDVTDEQSLDGLTANAAFSGVPVDVQAE
jgi:anaerobic selenocysteine-containing dehydrogenase